MNPIPCPFCGSETVISVGCYKCSTCGIRTEFVVAQWMAQMSPKARLRCIGYYHAVHRWAYGWCLPEMSRSQVRAYAQGFLSAPNNRGKRKRELCFEGQQARKDAAYFGCFWL